MSIVDYSKMMKSIKDTYGKKTAKNIKKIGWAVSGATIFFLGQTYLPTIIDNMRPSFNHVEHRQYAINATKIDVNGDGIVDGGMMVYDLNSNGKEDTAAIYKFSSLEKNGSKAKYLVKDSNEDGILDYYYIDYDEDGYFDEKIKGSIDAKVLEDTWSKR